VACGEIDQGLSLAELPDALTVAETEKEAEVDP
jgi:hypothetical protein